jgi:hypothetical protein
MPKPDFFTPRPVGGGVAEAKTRHWQSVGGSADFTDHVPPRDWSVVDGDYVVCRRPCIGLA